MIKCLNKAVAANSDSTEVVVATRFWQRIGIDLLRGNCRSFHRRIDNDRGEHGASGLGLYFQTLSGLTMPATAWAVVGMCLTRLAPSGVADSLCRASYARAGLRRLSTAGAPSLFRMVVDMLAYMYQHGVLW